MCGFGVQTQNHLEANRSIYPVGCADKAVMWIESHLLLVGALALGLALPQVRPRAQFPALIGCSHVTSVTLSDEVTPDFSYFSSHPAVDASVGCSRTCRDRYIDDLRRVWTGPVKRHRENSQSLRSLHRDCRNKHTHRSMVQLRSPIRQIKSPRHVKVHARLRYVPEY